MAHAAGQWTLKDTHQQEHVNTCLGCERSLNAALLGYERRDSRRSSTHVLRSLAKLKLGLALQVTASVDTEHNTHCRRITREHWVMADSIDDTLANGLLTVWGASQHVEAKADLIVVVQRKDPDVRGGDGGSEKLGLRSIPV